MFYAIYGKEVVFKNCIINTIRKEPDIGYFSHEIHDATAIINVLKVSH
jgi:hypothetical protein